ncbi:MAG: hypothetical protein JRE58_14995 [Deltaproteobacteria bacterium]|nr:hypothetical protein [Deltaproteobacteria bacterium]
MKFIRILLLLCAVCLLTTPVASAQNGAVIVRGEALFAWYDWNGESVLTVQSSDSELFCNEFGDMMYVDWMEVWRPDGTIKYHEGGHFFTRVFYPATPADFDADPCALWNNGDLMVAEGIINSPFNDNDFFAEHPNRRNTAGYNVAGTLYDTGGLCDGGMVDLNTIRRTVFKKDYPACEPDCIFKEVRKGPRLSCPD